MDLTVFWKSVANHVPGLPPVRESVTGNIDLTVFWKSVANHVPGLPPVRESVTGNMDLTVFWKSVANHVPGLPPLASRYAFSTCLTAHAEPSFTLYKLVLSSRRRNSRKTTSMV
ncbi:hypothetical protein RRG08_000422 [Elysia crispata]|uniref:Uncharacterized protein n=1 Tax=Elysia crispata TaxID=231223 RepID=A0AAE0ZRZ6_9GAST|nr:hypothetical protein RRG08_000422 [Elysia crispata]